MPQTRASYDKVAEHYAAEIGRELRGKPLDRALLDTFAELTAGRTVLDLGCGPGHVAAYLAGRGVRAAGLDLSPAMCVIGRRDTGLPFCAADMTALPVRDAALGGIVCFYAVIHLDERQRAAAYREFARALAPGGHALVAFHTGDLAYATGTAQVLRLWWDEEVDLTFRYLDPVVEIDALGRAGLELVARLDRMPDPATEHASQRSYLLVRRSAGD
ncbi:class I SAM-dependent methyltransferase [Hamadaea tsunoensis]|uniref:class I SAM-dependent methyltransferase n=1 Tax=Hamadaea tsunoensis TaxID=53368 RepID=UPI00041B146D|nr:class I SAM-dependent methyltransferase [Hamadaea tsunoensis]